MKCEVVAIGTELLLGQIVDTNSSWIGEQLASVGIDSHYQTKVGDNLDRIVEVLDLALSRSDAVICTGGLGPTQDDITRLAIATWADVPLRSDDTLLAKIEAMWGSRGREMPAINAVQAQLPHGAGAIPVQPGTAPGIVMTVTREGIDKLIYAMPGVPWEMHEMMHGFVLPDLIARSGIESVIKSRTLRTWGSSESSLSEQLADEIERLEGSGETTLAFLASGIEGVKVRITAKADSDTDVEALLQNEEAKVREIIGPVVFGVDDETIERVVLDLCTKQGLTLATAESVTGGLIAQRITATPGSSSVYRGSVISYATEVKSALLGAEPGPSVTEEMVEQMALGASQKLGADVSVATTGVAGPDAWEGIPPGTVWIATCVDGEVETQLLRFKNDRERTRQYTSITVMNVLRQRLERRAVPQA